MIKASVSATIDGDRIIPALQLKGLAAAELTVAIEITYRGAKFTVPSLRDAEDMLKALSSPPSASSEGRDV